VAKDPYKLLGVDRSASDEDIRKAYRTLAKKMHPDVNPGNEAAANKFKEISAAYSLLSDKKLRAQYDSGQVDASGQTQSPFGRGFGQNGGFQHTGFGGGSDDISDLFSSLFGMNMGPQTGGSRRQGYRQRPVPKKGGDLKYTLALTFFESLKGGNKRIKLKDGQSLNVKIPDGVEDGAVLRLRGKGQTGHHGGANGDARVHITVKPHKYYVREGNVLRLSLPITLKEAILGAKVNLPMPSGAVKLNIPAGNSGKALRLKGKGVQGSDLIVTPYIVLSDNISETLVAWARSEPDDMVFNPRVNLNG